MPADDCGVLELSAAAWRAAVGAMQDASPVDAQDAQRLFDGITRWRSHRTRWRPKDPQRARAQYLVEAAARLSLLDAVHSRGVGEGARGVCRTLLADLEDEATRTPFVPASTSEEAMRALGEVTDRWRERGSRQREVAHLAPAAHALLVTRAAARTAAAQTDLLRVAERVSTLCAAREVLRTIVRDATPGESAHEAAVSAWVLRRAAAPKSEAASRMHAEALADDMLDPARRGDDGAKLSVPVLVTMQTQQRATLIAAAMQEGVGMLVREERDAPARDAAVLALSVFSEAAQSLHGLRWSEAYVASDSKPEAALSRLRAYASDRMVNPPPVLLLLDHSLYAVRRRLQGAGLGRVTVHCTGSSALAAWVDDARDHPSVGPRMRSLLAEVCAPEPDGDAGRGMELDAIELS